MIAIRLFHKTSCSPVTADKTLLRMTSMGRAKSKNWAERALWRGASANYSSEWFDGGVVSIRLSDPHHAATRAAHAWADDRRWGLNSQRWSAFYMHTVHGRAACFYRGNIHEADEALSQTGEGSWQKKQRVDAILQCRKQELTSKARSLSECYLTDCAFAIAAYSPCCLTKSSCVPCSTTAPSSST